MKNYGVLPEYYVLKEDIEKLGWQNGKSPSKYAPGKMITRGIYFNINGKLPHEPDRTWYEAD